MPTELTRRVRFSAAHRYRRPDWDDARNERVFGRCAGEENFHRRIQGQAGLTPS